MYNILHNEFDKHIQIAQHTMMAIQDPIIQAAKIIIKSLDNHGKLLICGNGGSAADAQHIAAELTGRYKKDRQAIAAIALSTDTSALTAIANDYGYEYVFSRQIQALAHKGDVLLGISTSGSSPNIISALKEAQKHQCVLIGLSGKGGGAMKEICDINIIIPSDDTPRIQEMHILIGHILCQIIEQHFIGG